jgi:hypothetical protein
MHEVAIYTDRECSMTHEEWLLISIHFVNGAESHGDGVVTGMKALERYDTAEICVMKEWNNEFDEVRANEAESRLHSAACVVDGILCLRMSVSCTDSS